MSLHVEVADVKRAAVFFGAVLGWSFAAGSGPQGRQVQTAVTPRHGLWGDQERPTLLLCHAVDDLAAVVTQVRAAGGQAQQPEQRPYGLLADCVDDQGTRFYLGQH